MLGPLHNTLLIIETEMLSILIYQHARQHARVVITLNK
jgi:hypothetical protein